MSPDDYQLRAWTPGAHASLSDDNLFRRALRVIRVTEASKLGATASFDEMVARIERNVGMEADNGSISTAWEPTCADPATCIACDFLSFCPDPAGGADVDAPLDDDDIA